MTATATPTTAIHIPAGTDRFGENNLKIWGFVPLCTKVSSKDTNGTWYLFEHTNMPKGGPPRHIRHDQDEWFFVIKGEFLMEVGGQTYRLHPGDSLFAPRKVPHVWAHVDDQPGTLLTAVTPAGTFETFIRETADHATLPSPDDIARAFADHGMTVVGPPLTVD